MVSAMSDDDLIEFVRSYREPTSIDEVAADLANLGRFGASIPKGSKTKWTSELRRLVSEDRLKIDRSKMVSIPMPVAKQSSAPSLPHVNSQQLTFSLMESQ